MNKKVIIISVVALAGLGAFFYFTSKKKGSTNLPNTSKADTSTPSSTVSQNTDTASNTPAKDSSEKKLTEQEIQVLMSLRDVILHDINRKGSYKRTATRNAVQKDIDSNIAILKSLGYVLDEQNNLVKIDK
jgi:hypothetical protein